MTHYATQISALDLLKQLRTSKGHDDVSADEVDLLVAMVLNAAETIGPVLDRIPLTFQQYTQHDLRHSANVIKLMGKFIPKRTRKQLNAVELAVLALSAIVHDAGMFVSDGEKKAVVNSAEYRRFEAGQGDRAALLEKARAEEEHLLAAGLQDALLAEYFRRLHPGRAAAVVTDHLKGKLVFRDTDLAPTVLRVAESHGWSVLESNDPHNPEQSVSRLSTRRPVSNVPVNEQYLACCLRLADIMDFDRSRTPASVFQHLRFTEEKSWEEWNKHLQVRGWHVSEHEVMYSIPCSHPAFYVAVMEFLDWIDAELRECRQLVKEAPRNIAERYELDLPPVVDRRQVEMEDPSYLAGAFRFQLDYERILQLLMDRSLYPDPSLFLRELLQNALDACRTREAHAKAAGAPYTARLAVWDHLNDPDDPRIVFQDNGIGMSRRIVENYFMRVGRSYYKSAEFDLQRQRLAEQGVGLEATSQFGIGILSCFMVADRFEVETYRVGNRPLHITIEGPTKYFTIRILPEPPRTEFATLPASEADDGPPSHPGTRITVYLRKGVEIDTRAFLDKFAVNVEYEIHLYSRHLDARYVVDALRFRHHPPRLLGNLSFLHHLSREVEHENDVAKALESILVPARVPLKNYEFSQHLDGQVWFWLLQGPDGEPCPERGLLKIGKSLGCTGVAAFAAALSFHERAGHIKQVNLRLHYLADLLKSGIAKSKNPFEMIYVPPNEEADGEIGPDFWSEYAKWWDRLSDDERTVLLAYIENRESGAVPWFMNEQAAGELLRGEPGWACRHIDVEAELEKIPASETWALYGILLPGGIVDWDPMSASVRRATLPIRPAGAAVDIRDQGAVPVASRLHIDTSILDKATLPILRALIRYGSELCSTHQGDPLAWRRWLSEAVVPLFYNDRWEEALRRLELTHLEQTHGYLCRFGEMRIVLSREELITKFGRWVPYAPYGEQDGIDRHDALNRLLLARKLSGHLQGGVEVVDLVREWQSTS